MTWNNDENLLKILKNKGVVVMPTDTIYGVLGRAEDRDTVERIYQIRKRSPEKACIILIGDLEELKKFNIFLSEAEQKQIEKYTEPTSFILDCADEKFAYLHRGTKTLAFRLPHPEELRNLLKETGPLIAPSANIEDGLPAQNITEAKKYFGNLVDLYVDGGAIARPASKIVRLHKDDSVSILRE